MPKKMIRVSWQCNLCYQEYTTKETAQNCENRGFAIPRFKKWDLVLVKLNGKEEVIGQVTDCGPDDVFPDPHLLPGRYVINVSYRDYNPQNHHPPENNPLRRHRITVVYDSIKPYPIKNNTVCPVCKSTETRNETEKIYYPYRFIQVGFLTNIKFSRCGDCGLRFFTKRQSEVVNRKVLVQFKGKIRANTKRLAEERAYQFS